MYIENFNYFIVGATKLFGAYPVSPLIEPEIGKKCKVTDKSIMDNVHRATTGRLYKYV